MLAQHPKVTKTKAFLLSEIEDDILFYEYYDNILITLDDIKEAYAFYEELAGINRKKVLISFGAYTSISVEAREFAEKVEMPAIAQAMIIKNLAHRILTKFYNLFRKDQHPLKFFKNIEDAKKWLREQ